MKLKKLLDVMTMSQPIKIVSVNGNVTEKSLVFTMSDPFYKALMSTLKNYKVHSIRHVHDDLIRVPEQQDYIEITIIGGTDK